MNPAQPQVTLVSQFAFFLIMALPFVIFMARMAKRKGRSSWQALWGVVPIVNLFVAIWMASLPEESILRQLRELKESQSSRLP